jgi:hypothetical protein
MDGKRFDDLSRRLSRATTRRGTLKAAVAALVVGGMATNHDGAAASKPRRGRPFGATCTADQQCASPLVCQRDRRFSRTQRNRCGCAFGTVWCARAGACVTLGTNAHCSGCGDACAGDFDCCGGACVDLSGSSDHCGACDEPCDPERSDACGGGSCLCGSEPACGTGAACVDGACIVSGCEVEAGASICIVDIEGSVLQGCGYEPLTDNDFESIACDSTADCVQECVSAGRCVCARGVGNVNEYFPLADVDGVCIFHAPADGGCFR